VSFKLNPDSVKVNQHGKISWSDDLGQMIWRRCLACIIADIVHLFPKKRHFGARFRRDFKKCSPENCRFTLAELPFSSEVMFEHTDTKPTDCCISSRFTGFD